MTDKNRPDDPRDPPALPSVERHGRELKAVNAQLRELIDSLKVARERRTRLAEGAEPGAPTPVAVGAPDDVERRRLAAELALAQEALDERRAESDRLRQRLEEIEQENQRLYDEFLSVAEESARIANLYVALQRLHGTRDHGEVLTAIEEIVINLLGSEELAIYELDRAGRELVAARAFGLPAARVAPVPLGAGDVGRIAAAGGLFVADGSKHAEDPDLTACVPLRAGEELVGAIAVYRLLGQKPALGPADRELLDLLATHAALALHFTRDRAGMAA